MGAKETYSRDPYTVGVYVKEGTQVTVRCDLKCSVLARDILAQHFATEHESVRGAKRSAMWVSMNNAVRSVLDAATPDVL